MDNSDLEAKLRIRRFMLETYHRDAPPRVFDACQGSGLIWAILRQEYSLAGYMGCDIKPRLPGQQGIQFDSRRILQGPIPGDFIDIDTYGSPWLHVAAVIAHPPRPLSMVITIGHVGGMTSIPREVARATGLDRLSKVSPLLAMRAASRIQVEYCLASALDCGWDVAIHEGRRAENARYIGIRMVPDVTHVL